MYIDGAHLSEWHSGSQNPMLFSLTDMEAIWNSKVETAIDCFNLTTPFDRSTSIMVPEDHDSLAESAVAAWINDILRQFIIINQHKFAPFPLYNTDVASYNEH